MSGGQMSDVVQHLHRAVLLRDGAGLTDGQLLERFVSRREEAAVAALVGRHGPMVWGVCRRVLRNAADAEDAFQATFLVLIRKAASVAPREMVANWLYGVAHQTALKARATAGKRRARERQVTVMPEPETVEQDLGRDLQPLLDQELSRLPDKYRAAIVLCDLDGKSRKEAARQLDVPEGTVASRLMRARTMLARRLARHGRTVAGESLAAVLAQTAASASVPTSVTAHTIQAATLAATGQAATDGVISAKVAALTEGVLKAMLLNKLKTGIAALLVLLAVAGLSGALALCAGATAPPQKEEIKAPQEKPAEPAAKGKNTVDVAASPLVARGNATVHRLAWHPDGNTLATTEWTYEIVRFTDEAGNDKGMGALWPNSTIKIWDAKTAKLVRSLAEEKHTNIMAIAFSPDRKTVAVSYAKQHEEPRKGKGEVRLMDARTWALRDTIDIGGGAGAAALAFSPDGTRLAIGGGNLNLKNRSFLMLWDASKRKRIGGTRDEPKADNHALPPKGQVFCLAFSGDGATLAAGGHDGTIRLFDGVTGDLTRRWEGHQEWITGLGFSPDKKSLVSAGGDKTVKVWDVQAGKLCETVFVESEAPAFTFSADGKLWATAGVTKKDGQPMIELILGQETTDDIRFAPLLYRVKMPFLYHPVSPAFSVHTLAFSPDGTTLAIGGGDTLTLGPNTGDDIQASGELRLWKLK